MPSPLTIALGAAAIVLGVAWIIWPMRMIRLQYRVLYFWVGDDPDLSQTNETVARAGGLVLALIGVVAVLGIEF